MPSKRLLAPRPVKIVLPRASRPPSSSVETVPQFQPLGRAPIADVPREVAPAPEEKCPMETEAPCASERIQQESPVLFGTRRVADPSMFPPSLKILNPSAWTQLWTHLNSPRSHVPVFVHGPTGCGKTRGIHELVEHMGLRPVCLDAVEADDTTQLINWVRRTREAHTLQRQSVVILDDLEGFTLHARAALAKLSKDERPELNPMILVCNARRDPAWKDFSRNAVEVRLFAPSAHTLTRWFTTCYRWTSVRDDVERVGVSEEALRLHGGALLKHGDIRRVRTALETCNQLGANLALQHDQYVLNSFDACRRLLRGDLHPEPWTALTEPRDAALLQYHATPLATDLDEIANCLDAFSLADTMAPDRAELLGALAPTSQFIQAAAVPVRLPTRSRDVGALCPPPRPPRHIRPEEESQWRTLRSSGRT